MGTGTGDLFRDALGRHGCGHMVDARGRARTRVYFLSQISCTAVQYQVPGTIPCSAGGEWRVISITRETGSVSSCRPSSRNFPRVLGSKSKKTMPRCTPSTKISVTRVPWFDVCSTLLSRRASLPQLNTERLKQPWPVRTMLVLALTRKRELIR